MEETASRARRPRADARRHRERLLAAADEICGAGGADAPLEHVARQAGVGGGSVGSVGSVGSGGSAARSARRVGRGGWRPWVAATIELGQHFLQVRAPMRLQQRQ